jgi:pre-rRNA-processing protein IPI1
LTSLLTLHHTEPLPSKAKPKEKSIQKSTSVTSLPLDRVSEYVSLLLTGEAVSGDGLLRPLTLNAYCALLPTLWSLVNNIGRSSDGSVGEETVKIVVDHAMRVGSTGASKRATVEFVGRLMLVRSFVIYSFQANPNLMSRLTAQNGAGV